METFESMVVFSGWLPILRVLIVGTCGYIFLLFALRIVGPRTLAKTNIFDFIILVSVGSVYGRILTAKDVGLLEALVAYALVVTMHYVVSWLRFRSDRLAQLLDADPVLLFYEGRYIPLTMRRARIREADIQAAVRERGLGSTSEIEAIVLEADGELSILRKDARQSPLVANLQAPG